MQPIWDLQIAVAVMVAGGLLMFLVIHFIRRDGLQHSCLGCLSMPSPAFELLKCVKAWADSPAFLSHRPPKTFT